MFEMSTLVCSGCKRRVFSAKVWHDDVVLCRDCTLVWNRRTILHELYTPMRGHDPDGECCRLAERGVTPDLPTSAEETM